MILHGQIAVAELKRQPHQRARGRNGGSPRRIRRGRIEAALRGAPESVSASSPRRIRRGRIEARTDRGLVHGTGDLLHGEFAVAALKPPWQALRNRKATFSTANSPWP